MMKNLKSALSILAALFLSTTAGVHAASAAAPDDPSVGLAVQLDTPCPGVTEGSVGHDAGRLASCRDGVWRAVPNDVPPAGGRKFLSVDGLRDMLPKLYERALKEPTDENVASYVYAQRLVLDLAQRVAEKCAASDNKSLTAAPRAAAADDGIIRGCVERTLQEQL